MFEIVGQLRMPLHEQAKSSVEPFHSLDNPIFAASCNYQPIAQVADGLVMARKNTGLFGTEELG
jgi:hypothetical protein